MPLRERRVANGVTSGYTFIEVAIVAAIIAILASVAMPLARVTMQRNREIELRRALREIRTAIDKYKDLADAQRISPNDLDNDAEGYPPTLKALVDGVTLTEGAPGGTGGTPSAGAPFGSTGGAFGSTGGRSGSTAGSGRPGTTPPKMRFLRHIPIDPMTRTTEWGLRSSRDEPDTKSWGGQNVYDVYTTAGGKGLDGTDYRDW